MTMHFRVGTTRGYVACGRGGYYPSSTSDIVRVTCARCVRTKAYRTAQATAPRPPVDLSNAQSVVDAVLDAAHRRAEEAGYYDVYDDIIETMELPAGLVAKPRSRRWRVEMVVEIPVKDARYAGGRAERLP